MARKRVFYWKLGAAIGAVSLMAVLVLRNYGSSNAGELPLTAVASVGEMRVLVIDRGDLSSINETAVSCELPSGVAKLVTILPEGARVKKGDLVASMDTDALVKSLNDQRVRVDMAETRVRTSRSDLIQAKSREGTENANALKKLKLSRIALKKYLDPQGEYTKEREKLRGALEEAKRAMVDAEDELAFVRTQLKKGFGEVSAVRSKELAVQQMVNRRNSAEAELRVLERFTREENETKLKFEAEDAERELERIRVAQRSAVEKVESELKNAETTVKIERETLARIQQQIDRCSLHAPADGIVVYSTSRYWDESSRIRPGAQLYNGQPVFTLPDLSRMKVKAKIHESVIKKVSVGMPASFQIDALPGRALHGKVTKIATIAQAEGWRGGGVKQYDTEISIDDLPAEAGLKPGMTAEVKIEINVIPEALQVPISAVAEYEGTKVVYVVHGDKVVRREVHDGEANDKFVQILDGLAIGEQVALDARSRAAADLKAHPEAGQQPKPAEEKAPALTASARPVR